MFVRILRNKGQHETLIHCHEVVMCDGPEPKTCILTMDQDHPTRRKSVELVKAECSVYYMNEEGKTIDHYTWDG